MDNIVIIGGGESGVGAALLARKKNIKVFVSDYGKISEIHRQTLEDNNIPFEEEGHTIENFDKADLIIVSPGIPESSKIIQYCRNQSKELISELEFAAGFYRGKILGVTGSNGKTTTVSLIHHLIGDSDFKVALGGNIGYSFSRILSANSDYDWVVLEISSFQLDNSKNLKIDLGVLLNITPDHLDRYDGDMRKYAQSKWILAKAVKEEGNLILNDNDEWIRTLEQDFPVNTNIHWLSAIVPVNPLSSKDDDSEFEIKLKGRHNRFNASVSILCAQLIGIDNKKIKEQLLSFDAIEHRLESVTLHHGIEYINDSKATNVDSTLYALEAVRAPVIWIAGGTDKGNDYAPLKKLVKEKVKVLICLTKYDEKLKDEFESLVDQVYSTEKVEEAVDLAVRNALNGDTVLLSPACASFDLFKNYEHRGQAFKECVLEKTR